VIGPQASNVIYQSGDRGTDEFTRAGSLAGWRDQIAAKATGNPLLMQAISTAFAGPLLDRVHSDGGGVHFVWDSSTGKTTLIRAGCSVWGGDGYLRTWRATANGLEGAATLFNDGLLALDEISECDPREIGAIVYSLANGRGKQRANRTGAARGVSRWRCVILSSGERTMATAMEEGNRRVKAGQEVRLLSLPASRTYGCWDNLHGFSTGAALSDHLKTAVKHHHGHAGRAFLERLTRDQSPMGEYLAKIAADTRFSPADADGQEKRAATRFAVIALAGELASRYGITGWASGDAIMAAGDCFAAWRAFRGQGNDETRQISEQISAFLDRHGDSRFSSADLSHEQIVVRDRAGWWKEGGEEGRLYYFTADAMREALRGHDLKRGLAMLEGLGVLVAAGNGDKAKAVRIGSRVIRAYLINPANLAGGRHVA
jgi:putative DNA primase/helicase